MDGEASDLDGGRHRVVCAVLVGDEKKEKSRGVCRGCLFNKRNGTKWITRWILATTSKRSGRPGGAENSPVLRVLS